MFTLHVPRRHKLVVYIWPTLQAMRTRIKTLPLVERDQRRTLAFFHAPAMKVHIGRSRVVQRKVVGQMHFVTGWLGAGVFAHELQHFISWWSVAKEYDVTGKDWERVSKLAGNLTKKFWRLFYEWEEAAKKERK